MHNNVFYRKKAVPSRRLKPFVKQESHEVKEYGNGCCHVQMKVLLTGFAEIAKSKRCRKMAIKMFVYFLSTSGFIYQTWVFLQMYLTYPTTLDTSEEYPDSFMHPAITICDANRILRQPLCKTYPEECIFEYTTYETFCDKYRRMCPGINPPDFNLGIPVSQYYNEQKQSNAFLNAVGPQKGSTLIFNCIRNGNFEGTYCNTSISVIQVPKIGLPYRCFSLFSSLLKPYEEPSNLTLIDVVSTSVAAMKVQILSVSPTGTLEANNHEQVCTCLLENLFSPENIVSRTECYMGIIESLFIPVAQFDDGYHIHMDMRPEEHFDTSHSVQAMVVFHDPRKAVNPMTEGISLIAGKYHQLFPTIERRESLPLPYSSNCTDYLKEWKKNGGNGPLSKDDCMEQCKIEAMVAEYGCVGRIITYPNEFPLCKNRAIYASAEVSRRCADSCQDACQENIYHVTSDTIMELHGQCNVTDEHCKSQFIIIRVNFNRMKIKKVKQIPRIESIELFSYIGGYLGMWLGVSLAAVYDLGEMIYDVINSAFLKRKRNKKTTTQME